MSVSNPDTKILPSKRQLRSGWQTVTSLSAQTFDFDIGATNDAIAIAVTVTVVVDVSSGGIKLFFFVTAAAAKIS